MDNQQLRRHYVYLSYDAERAYIGCSSCFGEPAEHDYLGSFADQTFKPIGKKVLQEFATRQEAGQAEKTLLRMFDAIHDSFFVNKAIVPVHSIEAMSATTIANFEKPEVLQKHHEAMIAIWQNEEHRAKQELHRATVLSDAMKEHWQDPEYKLATGLAIREGNAKSEKRKAWRESGKPQQNGTNRCRKFWDSFKTPEERQAFIDMRAERQRESYARRKAQRLDESRTSQANGDGSANQPKG